MNNTKNSFKDKWDKNPNLVFAETLDPNSDINKWIVNRNGFSSTKEFSTFLEGKGRILDAGCGNGRVTALLRELSNSETSEVVGIDLVAAKVAEENLKDYSNAKFYEKDLLGDLSDLGKFNFIYCQEVLHHTNDPQQAFNNVCSLLEDNGEIAIYVYKKKAPVREFVDDYIRDKIKDLDYDAAMKACTEITELGKALSETDFKVDIPKVEVLEIDKGEFDVQRFLYHFFVKCFWNPELSFEANVVINYDWYHPQNCSRHTMDEILDWFKAGGLEVNHQFEDYYGITVKGKKS